MTYNNKPAANKPKRRSLFGTLYNPHIGDSIKPIGEGAQIFVNLIAMVFAMNGLFPKDHPGLKGDKSVNLNLSDVIHIAWDNVALTKEGIPKAIVFFAVVIGLAAAILSILTMLPLMFMGHAHAQTYFTPGSTGTDVGYNLIEYLFGASGTHSSDGFNALQADYSSFTGGGTMPNMGFQTALWSALGFYSNAMLIMAGILLGYHLVSMVLNTAHSGVVMGKNANQVWAPLRLAAAVILLVPINGLNVGQMLVMQVAEWGSGLASNVWSNFKLAFTDGGHQLAGLTPGNSSAVVIDLINMGACEYSVNYSIYKGALGMTGPVLSDIVPGAFINGWNNGFTTSNPWTATGVPIQPTIDQITYDYDGNSTSHFQPLTMSAGKEDVCGSFTLPPYPAGTDTRGLIDQQLWTLHINAFWTAFNSAMQFASDNTLQFIKDNGGVTTGITLTGTSPFDIYKTYQSTLITGLTGIATTSIALTDPYAALGWVGAGSYFHQRAQLQGYVQGDAISYMPTTQGPKGQMPDGFVPWVMTSFSNESMAAATSPSIINTGGGGCSATAFTSDDVAYMAKTLVMTDNKADALLNIADKLAGHFGVWCPGAGARGVNFTGSDPLAQMAAWGHANMNLAMSLFDYGLLFNLLGGMASDTWSRIAMAAVAGVAAETAAQSWSISSLVGSLIPQPITDFMKSVTQTAAKVAAYAGAAALLGPGMATIGTALIGIGAVFFTLGVTFGLILPLIPFMHFFFGTVSWIALLFEAVIAMPLVALAHISPEGEGLPGPAKGAYQMAFSLMLRPVIMVFALICGFVVLALAVSVLNMFFVGAVSSSHAGGGSFPIVTKIICTILYVCIVVSVANHAFQLITSLPDKVFGWMGIRGASGSNMGDPSSIERNVGLASGYLSQRGMASAGRGAAAVGKGTGGAIGGVGRLATGAHMAGLVEAAEAQGSKQGAESGGSGTGGMIGNSGGAGGMSAAGAVPSGGGGGGGGNLGGGGNTGSGSGGGADDEGASSINPGAIAGMSQYAKDDEGASSINPGAVAGMSQYSGGNQGGGSTQANQATSSYQPKATSSFGERFAKGALRSTYNYAMNTGGGSGQMPHEAARDRAFDTAQSQAAGAARHAEMVDALKGNGGSGAAPAAPVEPVSGTPDSRAPAQEQGPLDMPSQHEQDLEDYKRATGVPDDE